VRHPRRATTGRTGRARTPSAALALALTLGALAACSGNAPRSSPVTEATEAPAQAPAASTVAPRPPADVPMYTVVPGDTIGKIATKLGVAAQLIVDANGLANANKISVGQKLRIPAGGKAADGSIVGGAAAAPGDAPAPPAASTTVKK